MHVETKRGRTSMSVALCLPSPTVIIPLLPKAQRWLSVAGPAGACLNILIRGFDVGVVPGSLCRGEAKQVLSHMLIL